MELDDVAALQRSNEEKLAWLRSQRAGATSATGTSGTGRVLSVTRRVVGSAGSSSAAPPPSAPSPPQRIKIEQATAMPARVRGTMSFASASVTLGNVKAFDLSSETDSDEPGDADEPIRRDHSPRYTLGNVKAFDDDSPIEETVLEDSVVSSSALSPTSPAVRSGSWCDAPDRTSGSFVLDESVADSESNPSNPEETPVHPTPASRAHFDAEDKPARAPTDAPPSQMPTAPPTPAPPTAAKAAAPSSPATPGASSVRSAPRHDACSGSKCAHAAGSSGGAGGAYSGGVVLSRRVISREASAADAKCQTDGGAAQQPPWAWGSVAPPPWAISGGGAGSWHPMHHAWAGGALAHSMTSAAPSMPVAKVVGWIMPDGKVRAAY